MLSIFGKISLIAACFFSCLQSTLPIFGYYRQNPYLIATTRPLAYGQFFFIISAYCFLTIAFLQNDFSIAYVAANSHVDLPLLYKTTAIWGAHEGSILLWIVILNFWTLIISIVAKDKIILPLTIAILGIISFSLLTFLIFTSNPFLENPSLQSGFDLNPLLQDPGFVFHPPFLYVGYVGLSAAFAITLASLLSKQLNGDWIKLTRNFAIAAWCFLTFGIMLGSWWAYRVLGWGGFWFWDPVENASLLPWIASTALFHVLIVADKRETADFFPNLEQSDKVIEKMSEKPEFTEVNEDFERIFSKRLAFDRGLERGLAKNWAVLLAIITFALSLMGTFLVRSGVLISVHSFANDPDRGIFLLLILGILISAAFIIYSFFMPKMIPPPKKLSFFSRENNLLINSALLMLALLTILLGTLYPLILDALHLGTISVGAPYFNTVLAPLIFILMFFMGLSSFCEWKNQSFQEIFSRIWKKILISLGIGILLSLFLDVLDAYAIISLTLSCWIFLSLIPLRMNPMTLAHIGFVILIIGVILSTSLNQEKEVRLQPGNAVHLGPYQFFFIDIEKTIGENYRGIRGQFEIFKHKKFVTNLFPEKRIYPVRNMIMTKVDIHPGIFRDLYIALGEPLEKNFWSVRLYYKPFIRWIWFGGFLMMMAGGLAILRRLPPIRNNLERKKCN